MSYRIKTRRGSVRVHACGHKPLNYGDAGCQRVSDEKPDALDVIIQRVDSVLNRIDLAIRTSIINMENCLED